MQSLNGGVDEVKGKVILTSVVGTNSDPSDALRSFPTVQVGPACFKNGSLDERAPVLSIDVQ